MNYNHKREVARDLYLTGNFSQKQIADKIGTTPKTMSGWVKKFNWDDMRTSLLTSKKQQLVFLYSQLATIEKNIKDKEGDKVFDTKDADKYLKTTVAIKNLESETGLGETIEVVTKIMKWLSKNDLEEAQAILDILDSYIQEIAA